MLINIKKILASQKNFWAGRTPLLAHVNKKPHPVDRAGQKNEERLVLMLLIRYESTELA